MAAERVASNRQADSPPATDRTQPPLRPRLVPGVQLAGQMQESAYKQPPWLLERNGAGYVQVTELIYRIAELSDGSHTIEEIAEQISSLGTPVSPPTIERIVSGLLIQRGLVLAPGQRDTPSAAAGSRSPLAIRMRMKMVGPNVVEPLADRLKFLYWPPLLVVLVGIALACHVWLYGFEGIAGPMRHALFSPGLMLVVLLIVVVGTGFHEFGHAVAMRYAGGRVGGMGAGLYVVYPAFYTDVSDNYRLKRWERVRTDVGGFYFNLLFSILLTVAYFITGQSFLLLVIVVTDVTIIQQMLPFLRLDGYWTLADITGIPDFFSQIVPFLRTIKPRWFPWPRAGNTVPELKPWAKVFFIGYILVTIPILALLLFLTVQAVPQILATSWDALAEQAGNLHDAWTGADAVLGLASATQAAILVMPTIGVLMLLYRLGKLATTRLWRWSSPTPARRLAGTGAGLALAGGLFLLWAPQLPSTLPAIGGKAGPLHEVVAFKPIPANARGTLGDLNVPVVHPGGRRASSQGAAATATPSATPSNAAAPVASASPGATPSVTVSPGASASATPTPATGGATTTSTVPPGTSATAPASPSAAPSATASPSATAAPSATASPAATPSPAGTASPSASAAAGP